MDEKSELPAGSLTEHHYYCPNKMTEGTFFAAFPALEICPACQNQLGADIGKCKCQVFPGDIHSVRTGTGTKYKIAAPRTFTSEFNIGDTVKTVGTEEFVV